MSKIITVPAGLKDDLLKIASKSDYPQVRVILARGEQNELHIHAQDEAQSLVNVARVALLDALLKYPYWDDTREPYSEEHDEAFQDVQMGFFEKVVSYIGQEYDIETKV